ncbi:MAG TPA: hypothetical protein VFX02_04035 [Gammaproteobacteria bacterium]|nr:hypothetical protein [Gammaproteobacteria bacterium]
MKIKYLLYGLAGILAVLLPIILLPVDDELDAEAAAWLQRANDSQDTESNGYYFLTGIIAAPEEDPLTAGRAIHEAYLQAERKFLNGELKFGEFMKHEYYPPGRQLPEPEGDYYCRLREAGCFKRLANNPAVLRDELKTHAVLLERYLRYRRFEFIKKLAQPAMHEPFFSYGHILRGQKLLQFRIILDNLSANREGALRLLHEDIRHTRRHLAASFTLIDKMINLNRLAEDLDLLFEIEQPGASRESVPPLTAQERSLEAAMVNEFGSISNYLKHLDHYSESEDSTLYSALTVATLKPNMSLNALLPYYRAVSALSLADATEFSRAVETGLPKMEIGFNLRNIGGWAFTDYDSPSLTEYSGRLHDVDCKITLINGVLAGKGTDIANPYDPEQRPHLDKATQALCFDGPLPDDLQRRCVRKDADLRL